MLKNGLTVSVVVPIYNEEKTLKGVIDTLLQGKLFDEILCVNDGSTDGSKKILDSLDSKVTVIHLKENKGKGYAMVTGVKKASSDLIFFLDADFTTPNIASLNKLLEPMLDKNTTASVGTLFDKKSPKKLLVDPICGQRVYYKKDLLPLLDKMKPSRWGVEILLNKAFKARKVAEVYLEDLGHLSKHLKHSPRDAIQDYIQEGIEMGKAVVPKNKLNKEDSKILKSLETAKNFVEYDQLIHRIKNKELKNALKDYVTKYLSDVREWLDSN